MLRKLLKSGVLTGVLAVLLVVTPVLAGALPAPATSINEAGAPLSGWVTVQPGATHWYQFKYNYDNSKKDNVPTQALVELMMQAPAKLTFEVWTPERLNAPLPDPAKKHQDNAVRTPVGMGTPMFLEKTSHWENAGGLNPHHKDYTVVTDGMHLIWAGSARTTDTYYVVVKNKGPAVGTYQLIISGPDVSFK